MSRMFLLSSLQAPALLPGAFTGMQSPGAVRQHWLERTSSGTPQLSPNTHSWPKTSKYWNEEIRSILVTWLLFENPFGLLFSSSFSAVTRWKDHSNFSHYGNLRFSCNWRVKVQNQNSHIAKLSKQVVMWLPLFWVIIYSTSGTDLKKDMKPYEFFLPLPGCSFCLCSLSLHPCFRVNPLLVENRRAEAKTYFSEPPSSGHFQEALPSPTAVLDLNS